MVDLDIGIDEIQHNFVVSSKRQDLTPSNNDNNSF